MARKRKRVKRQSEYIRPMYDHEGRVVCIKRFWKHPTKGWRSERIAGPERASKSAIRLGYFAFQIGKIDKLRSIPKSLRR